MPLSYSDFELRRASTEDAKACSKIVNDWIDGSVWLPRHHSREAIEDMIRAVFHCMSSGSLESRSRAIYLSMLKRAKSWGFTPPCHERALEKL